MSEHREKAVAAKHVDPLGANIDALLFLGDQMKRIADLLEGPTLSPAEHALERDYANLDESVAGLNHQIARAGGPTHPSTEKLRAALAETESYRATLDYTAARLRSKRLRDGL